MKKQLIRNTFWGTAELAVVMLSGLIVPRVFVTGMNLDYYGLFLTLSLFSTYGILSMLDFGMGGAVITFVAKYHQTDREKLRKLWTFSVLYFSAATVLAVLAGILTINWYSPEIKARLLALDVSSGILVPTILMLGIAFLSYLGESFLFGFNDYGYVKKVTIVQNIARVLAIILAIKAGQGLVLIMWLMAGLSAGRLLLVTWHLLASYPEFTVLCRFTYADAAEWLKYSAVLLVSSLTGFVFNSFNRLLITVSLPVAAMGSFDIASKPQTLIRGVLSALISAITPASAHYQAAGRQEKVRELFIRGTFWLNVLILPTLVFIAVLMKNFILLWLGPGQLSLAPYAQAVISYLFLFALSASLANVIIVGIGEAKKYMPVQIAASAATLALSFVGVKFYGLWGIIWAFVFGQAFANLGCLAVLMKILKFDLKAVLRELLLPTGRLLLPPLALASGLLYLGPFGPAAFGAAFLCYSAAVYGIYYALYLDPKEKEFLRSAAAELLSKLAPAGDAHSPG